MDTNFWVGIGVGGFISLLASIAANLFHSKMVSFLDNRKTGLHERRLRSALALREVITDLKEGRRDKYIYMLWISRNISTGFVVSIGFLAGAMVAFLIGAPPDLSSWADNSKSILTFVVCYFMLFVSAFFTFVSVRSSRRFYEISSALDDFDGYDTAFKARWSN
jgi:hypothetical protein